MRQYLVFAPPSGPCGRDGPEVSVVSSPLGRRRPGGPTAMNQVTRKFPLRKHDFLDEFLGPRRETGEWDISVEFLSRMGCGKSANLGGRIWLPCGISSTRTSAKANFTRDSTVTAWAVFPWG